MPNHDDDAPLSSSVSIELADTSEPLSVEDFDLDAFIDGMRPTRRSVKLHERADLIGVMDSLANEIESAPESDNVDHLIDAFTAARDTFLSSTALWTVEKRSTEWLTAQREQSAKAAGIKFDKDGQTTSHADGMRLLLDQVAGQIVEINGQPVTVGANRLRQIYDSNEGELNKLVVAVDNVNNIAAQSANVLTKDFSQRSSTARGGTAS